MTIPSISPPKTAPTRSMRLAMAPTCRAKLKCSVNRTWRRRYTKVIVLTTTSTPMMESAWRWLPKRCIASSHRREYGSFRVEILPTYFTSRSTAPLPSLTQKMLVSSTAMATGVAWPEANVVAVPPVFGTRPTTPPSRLVQ